MKKLYLIFLFFTVQIFIAQNSQQYYSGQFLNLNNKPQNFIKILNKNSGITELTDEQGFAIIAASRYDTLVWNNGKNIRVVEYVRELKNILEGQTSKRSVSYIYSRSYDSLTANKNLDQYNINNSKTNLNQKSDVYFSTVRKLKQKNDSTYFLKSQPKKYLVFNGNFTTSFDVKVRNQIPKLQNKYVQGRSENGNLIWQGPQTSELFSFGPDISTLGFDHQPYSYDINGKLIPIASGVSPAKIYDNSLFKEVFSYNNQFNLNSIYKKNDAEKFRLSLDLGQQKDQSYFYDQLDVSNNFKVKASGNIFRFYLNAGYNFNEIKATNTNRVGLFTRAYQNSLLTPVSFSNAQNLYLPGGGQRSYSQFADNPGFLFDQENKYNYLNRNEQYSFGLNKSWNYFKIDISQSYQEQKFVNRDRFKPSTAGFAAGIFNQRNQDNTLYNSTFRASYDLNGALDSNFSFDHILNNQEVKINHSLGKFYNYQRTAQDYVFNYKLNYDGEKISLGANVGNSFYISNTTQKQNYWLPKANAYITFDDIFDWYRFNVTLLGAYTELTSEADITKSSAGFATTLLNAQNANEYFPLEEISSFKNLKNVDVKEWKAGFKLNYRYNLRLEAEYFNREIYNDLFPVFSNNDLQLKNLANHTYSGFDVNLTYDNIFIADNIRSNQKISFFKYKDIVNRVDAGFNNLPIAGFSDIYATLSEGESLGAIRGSYFERDPNGKLIIDDFGYPKKANGLKIIADPTPDFVMKFTHQFSYKMLSLDINWEWKKGGETWDGTQAVLDYYGRSQKSGEERDVKNYIFEGVNANGNTNQIPVDFYNVNQPVTENRWTRYGFAGVAEDHVEKMDYVRINSVSVTANFNIAKLYRALGVTFFVNNILLWQAKKGADPSQNFYNFDNGAGLDYFNLPSFKTFGCAVSFKF